MQKWKVEIEIEEVGKDSEGEFFDESLTQTDMNRLIEKACAVINEEYEDVKVIDFDAFMLPEREWIIKSKTLLNHEYKVKLFQRLGKPYFECTCSDYLFRKHECKHIKQVKMQLAGEEQKNKLPTEEASD